MAWSTSYYDGTAPSNFGPMDADRREWLEKALNTSFAGEEDPNKVMQKAVTEIEEGRIPSGLDLLDYVSDFPDCAINVELLGALRVLVMLVRSENVEVVKKALLVLGLYLPNNQKIQLAAALKHDCLNVLKGAISTHADDSVAVHSCISAIGSLVRNEATLERSFIRDGGVEYLCKLATSSADMKTVQKVAAILSSLLIHDLTMSMGAIRQLVSEVYGSEVLDPTDIQFWETLAQLACGLVPGDGMAAIIARRRAWLASLNPDARTEYALEIDLLNAI